MGSFTSDLRRIKDRNIWLINMTILLVGIACGIVISLVAIHLNDRNYSEQDIGSLAAWFAFGIAAFAIPMGSFIDRFGAKNVLITSLVLYGASVSIFPFISYWFEMTALVRVVDGAASAGIWIGCETVLLARAGHRDKAFVTTVYAAAIGLGYMLGPFMSRLIVELSSIEGGYLCAGGVAVSTATLLWLRLDSDVHIPLEAPGDDEQEQEPQAPADVSMGKLIWEIKNSCFGNFAYGYFQASAVLFLPLYLMDKKGISESQAILFPGFFALGMLCFVNFAGRLGDRHGHLLLMRILAVIGTATVLGFVVLDSYPLMCLAIAIAGATIASISPISLALQGVILEPRFYSRGNAIYNSFYAAGMLLGPPVSGYLSDKHGGPVMLIHWAALWAAFIVFTVVFRADDPAYRKRGAAVAAGGA